MKVLHVVGARPNFMKVAPVLAALRKIAGVEQVLVHTGQHYDARMSEVFFQDLGMPDPDVHLGVGSGSHAQQTARVMAAVEPVLSQHRPDVVVVAGDVNSTLAAALVASKLLLPVAHVEAGLRSRDFTMPEEVNRVLTDRLSTLLFTPSRDGDHNLMIEGIDPARIHFVGNAMIDSLRAALPRAEERRACEALGLPRRGYALATLHRPANVDDPAVLARLLAALGEVASWLPVVLPVHPRTRARIEAAPALQARVRGAPQLRLIEPQGYLDFLSLTAHARLVLTDSGGLQEETTALSVPCLTLRENTERPVTVTEGTNVLVGRDPGLIVAAAAAILEGRGKQGQLPELWDGRAAERIADVLVQWGQASALGRHPARGESKPRQATR
jgi:UDP-N-acetylglucosamine 2-epimerase (non-hydrolysing)